MPQRLALLKLARNLMMSSHCIYSEPSMSLDHLESKPKNCEICKSSLRKQGGKFIATVPFFSETTNKEILNSVGEKSVVISQLLHPLGIAVSQERDRRFVCLKCARKVANCYKLFIELQRAFQSEDSRCNCTERSPERTEISHERSPTGITPSGKRRKQTREECEGSNPQRSSKRSLFSGENDGLSSVDEAIQNLMHIDVDVCVNLPPIVKIFVGYPSSLRVLERSCEDKWDGALAKHLCRENFQAAANAALKFMPFRRELVKAIAKEVKNELREYSRGSSCARYNGDPLSLEKFNNEELLEEAGKRMPITHSIVTVASKSSKYLLNKQALVLSAMLSTWLPRSNFIYRLNTVLTAGCCKTEVMDLFHRLGLCSHPNTIRAQLQSSADHFDSEIVMWKKKIENNRKQIKLLEEVVSCQTDSPDPDSMELCSVDFSPETVEKCQYFNEEIYKLCQTLLPDQGIEDRDVEMAIKSLKEEKLPKYRLAFRGRSMIPDRVSALKSKTMELLLYY